MGIISRLLFTELVTITFSTYASPFHMETEFFFYLFNKFSITDGDALYPFAFTNTIVFP